MVISRKFILLFTSSIVNVIVGVILLNESNTSRIFVASILFTIRTSSTYHKYPITWHFNRIPNILVLSRYCKYISEKMDDVGSPMARLSSCMYYKFYIENNFIFLGYGTF